MIVRLVRGLNRAQAKLAPAWGSAGQSQAGSHLFRRATPRLRAVAGGLNGGLYEQKSPRQLRVERG